MSDTSDTNVKEPESQTSGATATSSRPRPSLRELAERAKHTEAARRAAEPTPVPAELSPVRAEIASAPAVTTTPLPAPPSRPDGRESSFGMGGTNRPPAVAPAPRARSSYGLVAGASVAILGIAAACVFVMKGRHPAPTTQRADAPQAHVEATPAGKPPEAAAAPAAPAGDDVAPEPAPNGGAAAGLPAKTEAAAPERAVADKAAAPGAARAAPAGAPQAPAKSGDLAGAMQAAVGADKAPAAAAAPASEPSRPASNGSTPEQPPQGSVQAAIRAVMGAAKGCVSGADDVSRAQVTFSSAGVVTSVSVSGWAAGKPAAACLKDALKGAHVDRFNKPTFAVGVVVRP